MLVVEVDVVDVVLVVVGLVFECLTGANVVVGLVVVEDVVVDVDVGLMTLCINSCLGPTSEFWRDELASWLLVDVTTEVVGARVVVDVVVVDVVVDDVVVELAALVSAVLFAACCSMRLAVDPVT